MANKEDLQAKKLASQAVSVSPAAPTAPTQTIKATTRGSRVKLGRQSMIFVRKVELDPQTGLEKDAVFPKDYLAPDYVGNIKFTTGTKLDTIDIANNKFSQTFVTGFNPASEFTAVVTHGSPFQDLMDGIIEDFGLGSDAELEVLLYNKPLKIGANSKDKESAWGGQFVRYRVAVSSDNVFVGTDLNKVVSYTYKLHNAGDVSFLEIGALDSTTETTGTGWDTLMNALYKVVDITENGIWDNASVEKLVDVTPIIPKAVTPPAPPVE